MVSSGKSGSTNMPSSEESSGLNAAHPPPQPEKAEDEDNDDDSKPTLDEPPRDDVSCIGRIIKGLVAFYVTYDLPILILAAILLARIYPPLGADYLAADVTATWIAVAIIFFIGGMGLRTSEFAQAFKRLAFNIYVQAFNFFVVSAVVYGVCRFLLVANMLSRPLAHGMVICSCLPMAINSLIVMTACADGDEAAAIFNSAFGNIIGIFLSPVLILLYLGNTGDISLGEVFYKLTLKVIVPLIVGQFVQKFVAPAYGFYQKHKRKFKKVQELCLVFIVYTMFCNTFQSDRESDLGNVFLMILYQLILMLALMAVAWYSLKFFFRKEPRLQATGVFGCTQKTVALGVPLIASIYQGNPNVGLYSLPILVWLPMQLVVGSIVAPRIAKNVAFELQKLKAEGEAAVEGPKDIEASGESAQENGSGDVTTGDIAQPVDTVDQIEDAHKL